MPTVKKLIEDAMRELTALQEGEEASADTINDGRQMLIDLLAQWSATDLLVPFITTEQFTVGPSSATYTWRVGGTWNSAAPTDIASMSFVLSTQNEPIQRVDSSFFSQLQPIGMVGQPRFFWADRQATETIIRFDRAPFGGAVNVKSKKPFVTSTDFDLTDETEFPPEYSRMLRTHLAVELAPSLEKSVSPELGRNALDAMRIVRGYNNKPVPQMQHDVPGQRRGSYLPLTN